MHAIRITLDTKRLGGADVYLREELPDLLAKWSGGGVFRDDYEYAADGSLQIHLRTADAAITLPWIGSVLQRERIHGLALADAAEISGSEREQCWGGVFGPPSKSRFVGYPGAAPTSFQRSLDHMRTDHDRTELDFESMSWAGCALWRIGLSMEHGNEKLSSSDLRFGVDWTIERWSSEGNYTVAPADLRFQSISDLRIGMAWSRRADTAIIERIDRDRVGPKDRRGDAGIYRWSIRLRRPRRGEISFLSPGFSQKLLSWPFPGNPNRQLSPEDRGVLLSWQATEA